MSRTRRLSVALLATCLVAALAAAPTASAAGSGSGKSKSVTAHAAVTKKALARSIASVRRRTTRAERNLRTAQAAITALQTALVGVKGTADGTAAGLAAAIPVVTDALTQLRDGSLALKDGLEKLADGVLQLKAGLEAAGAGLTKLGDFVAAPEYGIGQLIILQPAPAAQAGSFIETPDIPDTVQQAMTTQQFVAQHTGNLAVAYGIRSGETDGTGAALPAGHCKVTVTNEGGSTETTAANGLLGGLPFQPVNDKSALTSTNPNNAGFPFGLKTNDNGVDEEDKTTTFVSSVAVTAGDTYTVGLSCVDLSPDAANPKA